MTTTEDVREMASETVAGDLLAMLVQEIRLLPDIWVKIGEQEQGEILDRVRKRVLDSVREAVRLIASAGRMTVTAELKKVTFADKVEAVFALSKRDPVAMELCHAQGLACLIVIAESNQHMGGVDDVKPDSDQMNLPGVSRDSGADSIIEQARRRSRGRKGDGKAAPDPADPLE